MVGGVVVVVRGIYDLAGRLRQLIVGHFGRVVQLLQYKLRVAVVDALAAQVEVEQVVDGLLLFGCKRVVHGHGGKVRLLHHHTMI